MKRQRNERLVLFLTTLAAIGLLVENVLMGWEIWMVPILIAGIITMWVAQLTQKPEYNFRIIYYFFYVVLILFYHGIHQSSLFDIVVVTSFAMLAYATFDRIYMLNAFLLESWISGKCISGIM